MSAEGLRRVAAEMRAYDLKPPKYLFEKVAGPLADLLDQIAAEEWCCDECKFDPYNGNTWVQRALAVCDAWESR
jgi:hypothetical protein